jgi:hypothetical protein
MTCQAVILWAAILIKTIKNLDNNNKTIYCNSNN